MKMPLQGFRILDWTVWQAGPGASMMLGDLGADVIKIEDKTTGDPSRGLEKGWSLNSGRRRQAYFECNNRNKRGIALDLRQQEAKDIVYRLVETSDVFVTNFRESVAARYGMDYETLSGHNPRLVYGLITGYGSKGPEADARSWDGMGQARSALMNQCTPERPCHIGAGLGDAATGIMSAYGIITALLVRQCQGVGQKVETSLLSSLLFNQWIGLGLQFIGGYPLPAIDRARATNPLMNLYKCSDARWIFVCHPEADRFWPNFCRALGIENLKDNPEFNTMAGRTENEELIGILDKTFATKTKDEWVKLLAENGCVCSPVQTYDELPADPQVVANNYLPEFDHPAYGKTNYAPIPVVFSKTPAALWRAAPEFGQHTEEVLMEVLGYDWNQIGILKEKGVI